MSKHSTNTWYTCNNLWLYLDWIFIRYLLRTRLYLNHDPHQKPKRVSYFDNCAQNQQHECGPQSNGDRGGQDHNGIDDVLVGTHAQVGGEMGQLETSRGGHGSHGAHGKQDASEDHEHVQAAQPLHALDAPHLVREESVDEDCYHMADPPERQLHDEIVEHDTWRKRTRGGHGEVHCKK